MSIQFQRAFWIILASSGLTSPAAAQQSGVTMTVESGGTKAGCVRWERFVESQPNATQPQLVRMFFRFRNECGRTIHIGFQYQTGCCADRVSMIANYRLAPGQVYGHASQGPYGYFDPLKDRYLNFWLFQTDQPFNKQNRVDMTRCYPRYDRQTSAPPCPPAFQI